MGYKRGTNRDQMTMTPMTPDDYVDDENPCRVIDAFVDKLNLAEMGFKYAVTSSTGCRPYAPGDMLKLYIYGYMNRIRSSRRLEAETKRNMEVIWLLNGLVPDDKTICNFRTDNRKELKEVFRMFNKLCISIGLFGRETVSIDGTKIKANNSRRHRFSKKDAEEQLSKLEKRITEFLNDLERGDQLEAGEERIDQAAVASALEKLKDRKTEIEDIIAKIEDNGGEPICTVDKDAALMKQSGGKGYDVCYNIQAAVDEENGLIAHFEVTNRANDISELSGMVRGTKEALGVENINVLADTGYSNGKEIASCAEAEDTCYIPKPKPSHQPEDKRYHRDQFVYDADNNTYTCPEGHVMTYKRTRERDGNMVYANRAACMGCPAKALCTKSATLREIERNPYQSEVEWADANAKANKGLYHRRMELSEHPFGVVKRVWGFSQYLCRGTERVEGETSLMFLAFNFRRALNILGVKKLIDTITMPAVLSQYVEKELNMAVA